MGLLTKLLRRRKGSIEPRGAAKPPVPAPESTPSGPVKAQALIESLPAHLKGHQVPVLPATAFAEVLFEKTTGVAMPLGTQLVFYEALQMKGNAIDLATEQSCYIEALLLFCVTSSLIAGELFRGVVELGARDDIPSVLAYRLGALPVKDVLEGMSIAVLEVNRVVELHGPGGLGGILASRAGKLLLIGTHEELWGQVQALPAIVQDHSIFVARLGHLRLSTHKSLAQAYPYPPGGEPPESLPGVASHETVEKRIEALIYRGGPDPRRSLEEALVLCDELIAKNPEYGRGWFQKSVVLAKLDRKDSSDCLRRAFALDPSLRKQFLETMERKRTR